MTGVLGNSKIFTDAEYASGDGPGFGPSINKRVNVLECPADTVERQGGMIRRSYAVAAPTRFMFLGVNANVVAGMFASYDSAVTEQNKNERHYRTFKISEAKGPAEVMIASEFAHQMNGVGVGWGAPFISSHSGGYGPQQFDDNPWQHPGNGTKFLHNGWVNYLFADGHVIPMNMTNPLKTPKEWYGVNTPAQPWGVWTRNAGD
jgi:prepilin-type processing-associated H-X9-DG protein